MVGSNRIKGNFRVTQALTAAPSFVPVAHMTRRRKAAIIVRVLLNEGANLPLETLPTSLQSALTEEIGAMRYIDADTLRGVVGEFLGELEKIGLTFPGGIEGALALLDGHINADLAASLRGGDNAGPDPWAVIAQKEPPELAKLAQGESPEVAAVLLSKLTTLKAADVLGLLPGDTARRIACAVSQTADVDPETVANIGQTLAEQAAAAPVRAFADTPDTRIGAILNMAPSAVRDALLEGLESQDAPFAAQVKKTIFTFDDIPARLRPLDVPTLTRSVDGERLATALAGKPDSPAAQFILDNMSRRVADQLREEIAETGTIDEKDAERAMSDVVATIRTLEDAGELTLLRPNDS